MVRDHLAQRVSTITGVHVTNEAFTRPPKPDMGDIALGCFAIAKELGQNPVEIAKKIVAEFGHDMRTVEKVEAAGPFVNVTIKAGEFIHLLVRDIEQDGDDYGACDDGKKQKLLFEYAQPNTHKEMHVGHLRNLILGSALVRLLRHAGWDVIPLSYHGDVGAHVAKCLWWMVERGRKSGAVSKHDGKIETSKAMGLSMGEVQELLDAVPKTDHTGKYLGGLYTEATRELAANPDHQQTVSGVQQALEADDPIWHKLWQETRHWSLDEMTDLFEELGVEIDRQYLESEVTAPGQKIVDELMEKGVATKSEGAIVVNLEDADLGVFLVRKSDGTSLYATKDLALAYLKLEEYPKAMRSVMLVDNRQSLYFKQLFETLKRMGYGVPTEHIGYEFVTLKGGAMSSREGNIVTYQDFRDEVFTYAWEETKKRHPDWNEGQLTYTAWALAIAGMKFGMLKQDPEKLFTFDMTEALAFDGDTGPYVQYSVVRLNAILKKADFPDIRGSEDPDCRILGEPQEKALALALARFNEVVRSSAAEMRPSALAHWSVETARLANAFYRDVPVMDAEDDKRAARLRLVYAARDVMTEGLKMLGIPVPEEM